MDAFFEDISANNVPTPPTQTTGPQPAQTTGPNNEFEELLSSLKENGKDESTPSFLIKELQESMERSLATKVVGLGGRGARLLRMPHFVTRTLHRCAPVSRAISPDVESRLRLLEALLNTLLQNDKSKDTVKARQDLQTLRVRKELWLVKKPNGKFEKPYPKYSFTAENRKRFCKFIKGVRLPDGFGSNFKQKVTADDNNITGMKSHDCHIMMHRLLPYGVQRYLPKNIAAPIIELCLFFKQLCARTLMQQDMAKAKKQSISIMIELEKIFPPAFFDIMIHVAIHLPDEAILGGPLRYRWMFPFERYMKKLKNYVRNKAKPEGSIAEGYVAEEALTFCSRYLKDDVETRFNRLGRNDDGLPEEEPDKFEVFRSVCKPTGRMKETRLTTDVMQAVVWFVLNNSPEVDADILAYREESPDNVETSFPAWFNYK
ncbi:hypothetical protein Tco_1237289, partial [Tanacetum coccineum]